MKELRMDRFVGLPFSVGCVSQSSVAVIAKQTKRPEQPADAAAAAAASPARPSGEDGGRRSIVKPRSVSFSRTALSFPRPNIAAGFQKLIRGFRSLSQLFLVVREDDDDDDDEEMEMVIGFPTDVQHVGHIGWDGFNGMAGGAMKAAAPELLQLPSSSSFSLRQFELGAMAPPRASAQ